MGQAGALDEHFVDVWVVILSVLVVFNGFWIICWRKADWGLCLYGLRRQKVVEGVYGR